MMRGCKGIEGGDGSQSYGLNRSYSYSLMIGGDDLMVGKLSLNYSYNPVWYLGLHPQMPPLPPKRMGKAKVASACTVPSLGLAVAAREAPQKAYFCDGGT